MHRRWMSLPLLTSAVTAFYPYTDKDHRPHKRDAPSTPSTSFQSRDDLVTIDLKKIYHKRDNTFNVLTSTPPTSPNAVAIDQDGSDYSYFSVVDFGSKDQPMYMLIDTGSANTWVMGQNCTSESCALHNLFAAHNSTTVNTTTNQWSFAYGTGSVSGIVATDTVKFANFTMNMGFGIASNASNDFENFPMDGILGLGRNSSNGMNVPTVMDSLKSQGKVDQSIIAVRINRAADNTRDGEIMFGGIDSNKYTGQISYTKTADDAAWEIAVDDVFVNGTACGLPGRTAIIDTGTSYILMPPPDAKNLHSLIPGSVESGETYSLPCSSNATVAISFSGVKYPISAKDYVGRPVASGSNTCSSNIVGHQAFGPTQWILGDVFLKNVYTVFDFDQAQIGFATPLPAKVASTSGTTTSTLTTSTVKATGTADSGKPSANSAVNIKKAASSFTQSYHFAFTMLVAFFVGLCI